MYKDYFRLGEMPFSIVPDPRFLFMSNRHREALAHLLYGIQGEGGIVLLTGEVGTGKTTICRSMLEQLPDNIDIAFILNPLMSAEELLQTICEEYHIAVTAERPGIKAYVDAIHHWLLEANARDRRAILIIDEAQNLNPLVLEQLRLLTNLETNSRKLMQIILIGQPELQEMLSRPEMRQVAQRVIARYHLTQLAPEEVRAYVGHRLRVSGAAQVIFPDALCKKLHQATGGVPRLINLVCDRALLGTYVQARQQVNAATLRQAIREVIAAHQPSRHPWRTIVATVLVIGLAGIAATTPPVNEAISAWLAPPPIPEPVAPPPPPAEPPKTEVPPQATASSLAANQSKSDAGPLKSIDWPERMARTESERLAFQALFDRNGINALGSPRGGNCRLAETQGLRCYAARGGITDLRLLDHPALIRLTDASRRDYAATLVALEPHTATLLIGGEERRVALADLADAWSGNFIVLWKAPAGFGEQLAPGQHGPAIPWLRQVMSKVDGIADNGSDVFDPELARRVRAFQLAEGIRPDGYVGPVTAIRISARSTPAGPRLINQREG
ncbi:ExeA family protein [Dechloromonas sp. HYN0024]|uniref:ExeA family protein n=1 Tax=Dechloromonas sp. HYN0024 TaxID=2231055 RepID=UPI000E436783|nr:AAA family ATPase [Dechloromonas sp. HYN0024]AXS80817.1 AAA family ATPase [Dechloromonas sp. HYN0024]